MTTYANFITNLSNLTVTGVNRKYAYTPASVEDLPASFPLIPQGQEGAMTLQAMGGWPTFRADLVVAYEAAAQSKPETNFANTMTMMDNLATALRGAVGTICKGKVTWSLRQSIVTVGGTDYWAVVASVVGNG